MLWLKKLQMSMGGSEARVKFIEELVASRDPKALDLIIELLKDRDGAVPTAAAAALGQLRDPRAVPPLMAALKDKEDYIRWAAADALAQIGSPAVEPLVAALQDKRGPVRELAARALGQIGTEALEPLIAVLKSPIKQMREAAAEALGNIKVERSVTVLLETMRDPDSGVRDKATRALVNVGKLAVTSLANLVNDPDEDLRRNARWALERLGTEPMDELYIRPVSHGKWQDVKDLDSPALESIAAMLQDPNRNTRLTAVTSLANIGDARAVPGLASMLEDPDRQVRETAVHALVKIGSQALDHLTLVYQEGSPEMRPRALQLLGYIGDPRAVDTMLEALRDPVAKVRSAAADALSTFKDPRTVDPLIAVLNDPETSVRFSAVGTLWQIGDPRALNALLPVLRDSDPAVRLRAAQALGNLGDERIVTPLLELFGADRAARVEVAVAIAKVAPARAVEPLLTLTREGGESAHEALELLVELLGVAGPTLSPADLQALAQLADPPPSAGPGKRSVRVPLDFSQLRQLASDELSRREAEQPHHPDAVGNAPVETRPAPVRAENRRAPRRPAKFVPIFIAETTTTVNPERGWVLDISDGGLGLKATRSYPVGNRLRLRPTVAAATLPWVEIEVRHCAAADDGWRLGGKFLKSPEYGVLVLLG